MMEQYKEELQTHYVISKRVQEESDIPMNLYTDQYDLYHGKTGEPYMGLVVFPNLATLSITYTHSDIKCALVLEPNLSKAELINISIEEVEEKNTIYSTHRKRPLRECFRIYGSFVKGERKSVLRGIFACFNGYSVWSRMH